MVWCQATGCGHESWSATEVEGVVMTDTRPDFRDATAWVATLVEATTPDQLGNPTPCTEWTVRDLLGHMVAVLGRLRVMGQGGNPFGVQAMLDGVADDEWDARFADALAGFDEVWSDDAVMGRDVQAPFGTMPGGQILGGYIFEYLVHGWDLAQATGQDSEADTDLAERTLAIARMVMPEQARGEGVPFGAPVEPRPGAKPTEQLANWLGRAS